MPFSPSQPLSVEVAMQRAITHHQAGRLQEAEHLYRAVLQAQPNQPDANHNLGVIACQVGQYAGGLPFLKAALAISPSNAQYTLSCAEALLGNGQPQDAFQLLQSTMQRGLDSAAAQSLMQRIAAALQNQPVQVKASKAAPADLNRLIGLYQSGQYALLEINANDLLKRDPQCGFAWKILGAGLQMMGKDGFLHAMNMAAKLLPKDAEAHSNLGIAQRNLGHLNDALANCQKALKIDPNFAHAHNGLGLTVRDLGRLDEAVASYRKAVKIKPDYAEAYSNLGDALRDLCRTEDAIKNYRQAIKLEPNFAIAHSHLGDALRDAGRLDEAMASYRRALQINPNDAEACSNLGDALRDTGQMDDAVASYRLALAINPDYALAHNNLGNLLRQTGQFEEAMACYRRAIEIDPNFAVAHNNLGNALRDTGQIDGALASFRRALELGSDFADIHNNLGNALWEIGQLDDAVLSLRQALEIKPNYAEAYCNLGNVLLDYGQLDDALACHRQALAINPNLAGAYDSLLMTLQYAPAITQEELFTAHRAFGEHYEQQLKPLWQAHGNSREPEKRLKIGYVSGDFRKHAVAYFIEPIFANHDKSQVEVFCYSNNATHDAFTDRLIAAADHWCPCFGMTDEQLAQRIRADGIDILVDLAGHTSRNRLLAFARKPAPIQITYLGYPGSSGLTAMDYRLTDRYTEPEPESCTTPSDIYYTEKLFRMPESLWCYHPADDMPDVTALPALANGYLTFGSFNNVNKINNGCIVLWAALLRSVPNARLLFATVPEGKMRTRLTAQFIEQGVESERIAFCGKLPPHAFLRKLQEVDVTLDPFPVNGATTTCESLWLGIPVLTLVGERFLSRAGLSVLSAAQLPEFAAATSEEYIKMAAALASDLPRLANIRTGLRERLKATPLLDQRRFTRNLENAYREMWRKYTTS